MLPRNIEAEKAQDAFIRRAYSVVPELVCTATQDYDYRSPALGGDQTPTEARTEARMLLHKPMRSCAGERAHWLTETLELERESAIAQLAFALDAYDGALSSQA